MEVHKNLPNKVFSLAMIQSELARNLSTIQHISMGFTPQTWEVVRKNGWTAGQNLEFLILTLQPLSSILRFPKLLFRIFSRAEKPSVSFEEIRNIYLGKVNESLDLPVSLQPEDAPKDRLLMLAEFEYYKKELLQVLKNWEEDDLDKFRVSHPMLGRLTIREALYFAICHTGYVGMKLQE